MNEHGEGIYLDVRTQAEFDAGHIEGAILLPHPFTYEQATQALNDKDALIRVYCRAGRRSSEAVAVLREMGFTNVVDIGGIE